MSSKTLDDIFRKFSNQTADKGITLTWSTEDSITEAKEEIKVLFKELIGRNEVDEVTGEISERQHNRNQLRNELRANIDNL